MPTVLKGDVFGPLDATRLSPGVLAILQAFVTTLDEVLARLPEGAQQQPLTDTQLRLTPVPMEPADPSGLLARLALMAQAKQSYTVNGLRVEAVAAGGTIGTVSAVTNVTAVGAVNGIGYNSQIAQSIQQSLVAFNTGYRASLVVTP